MTNRTWNGGNGDWYAPLDWSIDAGQTGAPGAGAPIPGDTLTVNSGTINLIGSEAEGAGLFDNAFITIGQSGTVTFALESAKLGKLFRVTDNGSLSLLTSGQSLFDGRITTTVSGAVVTLGAMAGGSSPAGLTLFTDSILSIGSGRTLDVAGTVTDESRYDDSINILDVTAAFGLIGTFVKASTVQGDGAIDLGLGGKLLVNGAASSATTFAFNDAAATLEIVSPTEFAGAVTGFQPGDAIDLTTTIGAYAIYSASQHTITLYQSASNLTVEATINNASAAAGALQAVSDGGNGTDIVYASTSPTLTYELAAADRAMGAETVRSTMMVTGTNTPITGTGVKIGIISDSFDYHASGSPDPANAAAAAGYLPSNPDGASAVQVVMDYDQSDVTNEGLAMAELIHQVAPGAALVFSLRDIRLEPRMTSPLRSRRCRMRDATSSSTIFHPTRAPHTR